MYSTHNEGKSVVVERFVRILKNKIYKYMISISKNAYIDKLYDTQIINTYITTMHIIKELKCKSKKSYIPIWSEECFVIKKVKNTISDLKREEIFGKFY